MLILLPLSRCCLCSRARLVQLRVSVFSDRLGGTCGFHSSSAEREHCPQIVKRIFGAIRGHRITGVRSYFFFGGYLRWTPTQVCTGGAADD